MDVALSPGSPCFYPCLLYNSEIYTCPESAQADKAEDAVHSGVIQASDSNVVEVPQSTLLSETKLFAVCYATGGGGTSDTTWRDSGIRLGSGRVRVGRGSQGWELRDALEQ